jgi:hypothetical protein
VTSFDDREKGFESKFAREQEIEFKAVARRNRLAGLWAGGVMGLEGQHLEDYARAIIKSDFEQPGDEDVIRKLVQDLSAAGMTESETDVRKKMDELMAVAREQLRAGG